MEIPKIHRRLATAVIDNQPAAQCIKQWDSPSTLFYCDPPYISTEMMYKGGFDMAAHEELADVLNNVAGKVALSYYDHPEIPRLYPESGWHYQRVQTRSTACGYAPRDPNGPPGKTKPIQSRTELLLTNFDPRNRKKYKRK
jgi:DNA adenine methylase